jgi:hypothetical protein
LVKTTSGIDLAGKSCQKGFSSLRRPCGLKGLNITPNWGIGEHTIFHSSLKNFVAMGVALDLNVRTLTTL